MKKYRVRQAAALLSALLFTLLLACSAKPVDDGKVQISTTSDQARDLFVQGRDLNDKLRVNDARPLFKQAVELDPQFAQAHLLLSQTQPTAAGFFASLEDARNSAASASEGEQWIIQAFDAGVNGDQVTQEQLLQKLVAAFPKDERAHNQLGNFYFGQQRWADAIEQYNQSIAIDSMYSQPYNQIGYAYRFTNRLDEAEKAFKKYIALIPDDPNPYDSYAELLLKMGRFEESIAQYERALQTQPTFAPSYVGIATNLDLMGRHEEARGRLQQLFEQSLNDGQRRTALGAMAGSYLEEGNHDAALEMVQKQYDIAKATEDYANMSGDVNFMGNILLDAGRFEAAQKKFEETIELQAKSKNTSAQVTELARLNYHYDAGRVAAWSGDVVKAKDHLANYQSKAEANQNQFQIWAAHQLAGIIAIQEKNWDEALTRLNQSNPQNPFNYYLIGLAFQGKGDAAQATEFINKAMNFNGVGNVLQSMARHRISEMQGKA